MEVSTFFLYLFLEWFLFLQLKSGRWQYSTLLKVITRGAEIHESLFMKNVVSCGLTAWNLLFELSVSWGFELWAQSKKRQSLRRGVINSKYSFFLFLHFPFTMASATRESHQDILEKLALPLLLGTLLQNNLLCFLRGYFKHLNHILGKPCSNYSAYKPGITIINSTPCLCECVPAGNEAPSDIHSCPGDLVQQRPQKKKKSTKTCLLKIHALTEIITTCVLEK